MFLTGEGALLAVSLAAVVCAVLSAWVLLRAAAPKPQKPKPAGSRAGNAGNVRRVIVPAGTAPKM